MNLDLNSVDSATHPKISATDENISASDIDECIEKIMHWAEQFYGQKTIVETRENFFDLSGKVFHDDHFFHERMSLFIDYFAFECKFQKTNDSMPESPFEAYTRQNSTNISSFRHTLFETNKSSSDSLEITDLLTKERTIISPRGSQRFDGISKKDVFQGFLYQVDESTYLSHGLIFHPKDAWRLLRKEIKKWQKKDDKASFQEDLYLWAKINLKAMRHAHVNPKEIYKAALLPK